MILGALKTANPRLMSLCHRSIMSSSSNLFQGTVPRGFNVPLNNERENSQSLPQRSHMEAALGFHRNFHVSKYRESIVPLAVGLGVAVTALGAKHAIEGWQSYQEKKAKGESVFGVSRYGTKFYEGGFEPKMHRREAALILGVRESADKKRVQNAYRRLLRLNHPDTGGSTFLATKLNEAKDLLLKGQ